MLAAPVASYGDVYFTTWKYTGAAGDCGAGVGKLYGLAMSTKNTPGGFGDLVLDPLTGNPMGSSKTYFDLPSYFDEAKGIPSSPIVTSDTIYFSTSMNANRVFWLKKRGWPGGGIRLKSWREVF